jgi:hypothetical protein
MQWSEPMATLDPELDVAVLLALYGWPDDPGLIFNERRADRPRDRNDLIGLAEIHGELPVDPIPGLDT